MSALSDIVKAELLSANVAIALANALMESDDLWKTIEDHINAEVERGGLYINLDLEGRPLAVFRFGEQGEEVPVPLKQLLADWDANDLYNKYKQDELANMKQATETVISWLRSFKVSVEAAIVMTDQDAQATPAQDP